MAFNTKNDDSAMSEINVTPLVDVMLVLLIIFIVTAPLLTQSVNVNLPETVKTNNVSDNPEEHIVTIQLYLGGKIEISKKEKILYTLQANDKEKLQQTFQSLLSSDKEMILAFSADKDSPHGEVMKVMALAQHAGILKMSFLTLEEH